jgi:transcriptional regulator with XRE-family HTH domain
MGNSKGRAKRRGIRNRLRVLRAERRMTQFQLAQKSRINPATVSLIENEHLVPTSAQRDRLARALNADVTELLLETIAS